MQINSDQVIAIADELHGIPDYIRETEIKVSVPCPVHGELAASISLTHPDKLQAACTAGCEVKALWHGLAKQSPTLARLWAEKKKEVKPKKLDPNPYVPLRDTALEPVFRRVPPQNIQNEQALLGAILNDNEILPEVTRVILPGDFYRESHREIFNAMRREFEAGHEVDAVTLSFSLKEKGILDAVGGAGYLAQLAADVPTSLNFTRYASIVKECAIKREYIRGLAESMEHAYNGTPLDQLKRHHEIISPESYSSDLPELIARDIQILSGRQFAAQQQKVKRSWVIDGMLAKKEISLWSGKVEHGKTTLIRTLVMCVLRGYPFLERGTYPGRVLYVMLDADGEALTYEMFGKLGIDWDNDPIDLLIDPVMCLRPNSFKQFHAKLLQLRPSLVVIDPIGRFQKIDEKDGGFNGYGMTYAMAQFSELARQSNAHFLLLHHIPRGRADGDDPATAAFGSIAIAGGCNARFSCIKQPGDIFSVVSSKGKGGGFIPFDGVQKLSKDPETEWVSLAGPIRWQDQADAIKPKVLEIIEASDERFTSEQLRQLVGCQRSIAGSAAKSLYKEGRINMDVTKSNKYLFSRKPQNELEIH